MKCTQVVPIIYFPFATTISTPSLLTVIQGLNFIISSLLNLLLSATHSSYPIKQTMSEFALPSSSSEEYLKSKKPMSFSSLLVSDFNLFCSFVFSHPFYSSYLLFLSLYIFKILSFLSPLFLTTSLFLLALFTTLHVHDTTQNTDSPESFYAKLGSLLGSKFDVSHENHELEAYKNVFEACSMEYVPEHETLEICSSEVTFVYKFCNVYEEAVENQPLDKEESEKCEKKVESKSVVVLDNWTNPAKNESKVQKVIVVNDENDNLLKLSDFPGSGQEKRDVNLMSLGSMRKEKEWRRTLACKLFEERHNADADVSNGAEGMDHLWETYENQTVEKKETKRVKEEEEEEEEEDDGIDQQKLCCLQALKLSTGKMHLGIAKPNLLKLSKAFKGFGRFYSATKRTKKP